MRRLLVLAAGLVLIGIGLLAVSVTQGGGTVSLFLIFPVYVGSDIWGFLGILCLIVSFFLGFFGYASRLPAESPPSPGQAAPPAREPERKFGGVIMLGPVPVIIGSDMKMSIIAIVLAIVLMVVLIVSMLLIIPSLVG
ncbi:MAG: DUF131 domain-containing protein [Thermoplasmata archaeon]